MEYKEMEDWTGNSAFQFPVLATFWPRRNLAGALICTSCTFSEGLFPSLKQILGRSFLSFVRIKCCGGGHTCQSLLYAFAFCEIENGCLYAIRCCSFAFHCLIVSHRTTIGFLALYDCRFRTPYCERQSTPGGEMMFLRNSILSIWPATKFNAWIISFLPPPDCPNSLVTCPLRFSSFFLWSLAHPAWRSSVRV